MDYQLVCQRLGNEIRQLRLNRGLTQLELATMSGVTRQKLIEIEQGRGSVALSGYARVIAALDGEFGITPVRLPTLDEIGAIFQ